MSLIEICSRLFLDSFKAALNIDTAALREISSNHLSLRCPPQKNTLSKTLALSPSFRVVNQNRCIF